MAIDTGMYAMTQFRVALAPETTLGTANTTTMQLVNIDGYPSVSRNVERMIDIRHGTGTIAKKADAYVNQYGQEKVFSFSGFIDSSTVVTSGMITNGIWYQIVTMEVGDSFVNVGTTTDLTGRVFKSTGTTPTTWTNGSKLQPLTIGMMLLENIIGTLVGVGPISYDVAYNYIGPEHYHGHDITSNIGTLTLALVSPEGDNTIIQPGCIVKSLKIAADVGSDGGRFKFDAELVSRHNANTGQAAPTSMVAYPTISYRTIFDLAAKQSIAGSDVVMNKMELTLDNQVKFFGFGASGIPNTIGRGLPEFLVTGLFGIKYDANTASIIPKQYDENDIVVELSNHATWASATFGLKGSYGQISDNFDPAEFEGGAFVDLPIKFLAHTSGNVIEIIP